MLDRVAMIKSYIHSWRWTCVCSIRQVIYSQELLAFLNCIFLRILYVGVEANFLDFGIEAQRFHNDEAR